MGGGRAPCCDKNKVKRGPWSPAEDFKLANFIQKNGHPNWRSLPKQAGEFSSSFLCACIMHVILVLQTSCSFGFSDRNFDSLVLSTPSDTPLIQVATESVF